MEFSIIACCQDGRQLTGSGYTTIDHVIQAVNDRAEMHVRKSTLLDCIVVVGVYGKTLRIPARGIVMIQADRRAWLTHVRVDLGCVFPEYVS